jgi:hypothetical protein
MITPLSHLLPPLPGFTALARTYAPWPVWSGSTTTPIRFQPMPKKAAVRAEELVPGPSRIPIGAVQGPPSPQTRSLGVPPKQKARARHHHQLDRGMTIARE